VSSCPSHPLTPFVSMLSRKLSQTSVALNERTEPGVEAECEPGVEVQCDLPLLALKLNKLCSDVLESTCLVTFCLLSLSHTIRCRAWVKSAKEVCLHRSRLTSRVYTLGTCKM
jgi:hypothetical protein